MIDAATAPVRPLPGARPGPPPAAARAARAARTAWRCALPPAALALVLGLWGIRREGTLWGDEAVTYEMARRSVPEIWATLGTADVVHGLHYLLMHVVFHAGEPGLVALRLPSVLAMAATAAGVALIGLRLAGPRAGLLAGLVLAVLPVVQRYAQEGRSYALVCALVTWATLLLLQRRWGAYGAVLLTACLLHEFAVLTLVAHAVTLYRPGGYGAGIRAGIRTGVRTEARAGTGSRGTDASGRPPRGWWRAAAVICVVLAPLALFSVTQSAQVDWIGRPDFAQVGAFAALAAVGVLCARSPGGDRVGALALPLLVLPSALLIVVSFGHPLFVDRYVLPYVVGFALLLGAALDHHWSRTVAGATAAAALLTLVAQGPHLRSPESRKNDVGAVADAVAELARPGDAVLFTPQRRRVWSLVHADGFRGLPDLSLDRSPRTSDTLFGTELAPAAIRDRMLEHPGRVLVLQDRRGQPLDAVPGEEMKREVLERHFRLVSERVVDQARIGVYVRRAAPAADAAPNAAE